MQAIFGLFTFYRYFTGSLRTALSKEYRFVLWFGKWKFHQTANIFQSLYVMFCTLVSLLRLVIASQSLLLVIVVVVVVDVGRECIFV